MRSTSSPLHFFTRLIICDCTLESVNVSVTVLKYEQLPTIIIRFNSHEWNKTPKYRANDFNVLSCRTVLDFLATVGVEETLRLKKQINTWPSCSHCKPALSPSLLARVKIRKVGTEPSDSTGGPIEEWEPGWFGLRHLSLLTSSPESDGSSCIDSGWDVEGSLLAIDSAQHTVQSIGDLHDL